MRCEKRKKVKIMVGEIRGGKGLGEKIEKKEEKRELELKVKLD